MSFFLASLKLRSLQYSSCFVIFVIGSVIFVIGSISGEDEGTKRKYRAGGAQYSSANIRVHSFVSLTFFTAMIVVNRPET